MLSVVLSGCQGVKEIFQLDVEVCGKLKRVER